LAAGSCELAIANWQVPDGDCQLASDNCQLATGNYQLAIASVMVHWQ
jgi:hypothetical protein